MITMGLKRNIGVPFGLFFQTNNPRRNFFATIIQIPENIMHI